MLNLVERVLLWKSKEQLTLPEPLKSVEGHHDLYDMVVGHLAYIIIIAGGVFSEL